MHPISRDEIFGQLRDIYDGQFTKTFGNGIERVYKSKFGIIAGVTPNIDAFASFHQELGERFLKYRMGGCGISEEDRIKRAMNNVHREEKMYTELRPLVSTYLDGIQVRHCPEIDSSVYKKIISLAMLISRMRGVVHRDKYDRQYVHAKAGHEIGTRIAKQLVKFGYGASIYLHQKEIGEEIYRLILKVALDSVPDKIEECLRVLYYNTPHEHDAMKTKDIFSKSEGLTLSTVNRCLQDLHMLGIVDQIGNRTNFSWVLGKEIRELIRKSEVYNV